jgi:hypothetical protein
MCPEHVYPFYREDAVKPSVDQLKGSCRQEISVEIVGARNAVK